MKTLLFIFNLLIFSFVQAQQDSLQINQLEEVIIVKKDPISEKFAVKKLNSLDIYFNPAANADPLKAITTLPASTNTDESANPSLRGGSPDRSRVYLNGSPVLNPVRFSRNDGLGNFSLFNTELIDKQYVYSSNPPLNFGNSSAGLVEIETKTQPINEFTQIALALSNVGLMRNQSLGNESFTQFYANYQCSDAIIGLNKKSLDQLHHFFTFDLGANTHLKINENLSFNTFNYFIDEKYSVLNRSLNFSGDVEASKKRFFSVNNLDYFTQKTKIRWASMVDFSDSGFRYGNMNSKIDNFQIFNGLSFKTRFSRNFTLQYGVDTSVFRYRYDAVFPQFYFSLKPDSPIVTNQKTTDFFYVEPYLYAHYSPDNQWNFSSALRKNIFLHKDSKNFVSYQFSANYTPNNQHRLLFSAGKYHSYTTPNYVIQNFNVLSSSQFALDYSFENERFILSSAVYYKVDKGDITANHYERFDKTQTFGNELSVDFKLNHQFSFSVSNIFLNQKYIIENQKYNTPLNLKYFIKSQLTYNNPKWFTASLIFATRPGNRFTPVQSAVFNSQVNDFQPIFGDWYSAEMPNYKRLDFSANRLFFIGKTAVIGFVSVNNLLNFNNSASVYYNSDYANLHYNHLQKRIFYFGAMVRF
ncbi:TonB-dependent receptor plug domain-containing protein [Capnocytophaga stomatis]|uniref:TonB-dependent receptor plug domain-containing protein n=1 Tax=Capnocytophaga stomatis TaxID=1848904 RepID=UPI001AC6745C|nr:hypothetical protein [Capnocytophaga stomatis]GIM50278.1 hypothetical protein CAPN003_17300 [Capnocytophaga stomatis]